MVVLIISLGLSSVLSAQSGGGGPLHKQHNTQTHIMKHIAQDA